MFCFLRKKWNEMNQTLHNKMAVLDCSLRLYWDVRSENLFNRKHNSIQLGQYKVPSVFIPQWIQWNYFFQMYFSTKIVVKMIKILVVNLVGANSWTIFPKWVSPISVFEISSSDSQRRSIDAFSGQHQPLNVSKHKYTLKYIRTVIKWKVT